VSDTYDKNIPIDRRAIYVFITS